MKDINEVLRISFPNSKPVVVQDLYVGFRPKPHQTILLVELNESESPGQFVVKVGRSGELKRELKAWEACRPRGLKNDVVLMAVEPKYHDNGTVACLVYQDAQQSIGMDRTVTLEEAFLGAVQNDDPIHESVANVISQVFHRLGHLLYRTAGASAPDESVAARPSRGGGGKRRGKSRRAASLLDLRLNGKHWLEASLEEWETCEAAVKTRREAGATIGTGKEEDGFCDPVDYLRYVLDEVRDAQPAANFVPVMMRGRAHGDLHGRNVLVGLVQGHAHWPALFDFEDMADDNLLVWDFVKLETELKIRAYDQIVRRSRATYPPQVWELESRWARETESLREQGQWQTQPARSATQRLGALIITIRSLAAFYLGDQFGRSADWLEEYYFALACYGVYAVRYTNQSPRERMAALVSAGTAAARFEYSRQHRRSL